MSCELVSHPYYQNPQLPSTYLALKSIRPVGGQPYYSTTPLGVFIINMLKVVLVSILVLAIYSQTACSNIPADHVYYLTSFCDRETACGKSCGNCTWGYAADKQRFGCGSVITCTRSGKSINLEVIDYGPNCDLQKKSGKPIIDASYSACHLFTGSNSCGWSDKLAVTCKKVSNAAMAFMVPRGQCTWDLRAATEEIPYCHIPTLAHRYNFQNIEQWVEHTSMLDGK